MTATAARSRLLAPWCQCDRWRATRQVPIHSLWISTSFLAGSYMSYPQGNDAGYTRLINS